MAKVIRINSDCFVLPEGMSTKDIQALAGFITSLTTVSHVYNWSTSEHISYSNKGATVQLEDIELVGKAEAEEVERKTRAEYVAKRDAQTAAE